MRTNSTGGNLPLYRDKVMWEIKVQKGQFDGLVGTAPFVIPPEFLYVYRCEGECNGHMAALLVDHETLGIDRLRRVAVSRDDLIAIYEPDEQSVDLESRRERDLLVSVS